MEQEDIETVLQELNDSSPQILLSMIVSPEGFTLAHQGNVDDSQGVGALYIELQLTCKKIIQELGCGELEEILLRTDTANVSISLIRDKGFLACMSTPDISAAKMQLLTWQSATKLTKLM